MEETKALNEVEVNKVEITEEPAKNKFVVFVKKHAKDVAFMAAIAVAAGVGYKFGLYKGFKNISTEETSDLVDAVSDAIEFTEF